MLCWWLEAAVELSHLGLKVGFEIHQQLATKRKLFCHCACEDAGDAYYASFMRKLRPVRSELGMYDPAVVFEHGRDVTIQYGASKGSSCLVEADEEPPHMIDADALESALIFSLALGSNVIDEIQVMRKIVIDGSNTGGFQRTALIALGGAIEVAGMRVGVQSICLEEDASKILSRNEKAKRYGLDRLGTPLVEIALEPITGKPADMALVALTLGRLLRSSKRVARGLGTIRQDVNVSILNGPVVEVKGVQKIEQLAQVIEFEAVRQHAMVLVARELSQRQITAEKIKADASLVADVTALLAKSDSKIIRRVLGDSGNVFLAIRAGGFAGILGMEPYPDVRLGKELGKIVGLFGLNGVIHSDEDLAKYGLAEQEIQSLKSELQIGSLDAFILVGGPKSSANLAVNAIIARIAASTKGVQPETRAATPDGRTEFMRPRAGSARMYPETDIPPIAVTPEMLQSSYARIPKPWDEMIGSVQTKYGLNKTLATQIFDSDLMPLFEDIVSETGVAPTFVASKLTEDFTSMERKGLDTKMLAPEYIRAVFVKLGRGDIAKEAVVPIFEALLRGEAESPDDAIRKLGSTSMPDEELSLAIDSIITEHASAIKEKGMASIGLLMGRAMATLRGKADGEKINRMLRDKLARQLAG